MNVTDEDVETLCVPHGKVETTDLDFTRPSRNPEARIIFSELQEALSAAQALDGIQLNSCTLKAGVGYPLLGSIRYCSESRQPYYSTLVSWQIPTTTAFIYFKGITKAKLEADRLAKIASWEGREISVTCTSKGQKPDSDIPVTVTGLPADVTKADIQKRLCPDATIVSFVSPADGVPFSPNTAQDLNQKLSDLCDPVNIVSADKTKLKGVAFTRVSEVAHVNELASRRIPFYHGNILKVHQRYSVRLKIVDGTLACIADQLDSLQQQRKEGSQLQIRQYGDNLRLWSSDQKELHRMRQLAEKVVYGELLVNPDGSIMWDVFFDREQGLNMFRKLNEKREGFIFADYRIRTVRVFGTAEQRKSIRDRVKKLLEVASVQKHSIRLETSMFGALIKHGLDDLSTRSGVEGKRLALLPTSRTLMVYGKQDIVDRVNDALLSFDRFPSHTPDCCVFCAEQQGDVLRLECSHLYCRECMRSFLRLMLGPELVSLKCMGDGSDGTVCSGRIHYTVLDWALEQREVDDLLEQSMLGYIKANPDYRFCPTFSCQFVYRTGPEGIVIQCSSCREWICTSCNIYFHEGLTCQEFRSTILSK
jgi:hypothetical protein